MSIMPPKSRIPNAPAIRREALRHGPNPAESADLPPLRPNPYGQITPAEYNYYLQRAERLRAETTLALIRAAAHGIRRFFARARAGAGKAAKSGRSGAYGGQSCRPA